MTILPVFQTTLRTASRTAAISLMASERMWPTPSRTFSGVSSPFSALTNSWAAAIRSVEGLVAVPDPHRQGLQALFPGVRGLGPLLRLEGEIEILQPLGVLGRADGRLEIRVELALSLDRLENRLLALGQFAQPMHAKLDLLDHNLVQIPGTFFAIPGNERNRIAFVQELDDTLDLNAPNLQILRDSAQVNRNRVVHRDLTLHQE